VPEFSMQIVSTRRSPQILPARKSSPPAFNEPEPAIAPEMMPAVGGLVFGGSFAFLGSQVARTYGHDIAQTMIRKGIPLVLEGVISPELALKLLPYITDPGFRMQAGAVSFGLAGFGLGVAMLWPNNDAGL
jgi:hypothetical protein